jgi:hypothetical protein
MMDPGLTTAVRWTTMYRTPARMDEDGFRIRIWIPPFSLSYSGFMYHVSVDESMSERIHSTQPLPVIHFRANATPLSDQDNTLCHVTVVAFEIRLESNFYYLFHASGRTCKYC